LTTACVTLSPRIHTPAKETTRDKATYTWRESGQNEKEDIHNTPRLRARKCNENETKVNTDAVPVQSQTHFPS
jgi:hypothetical protein